MRIIVELGDGTHEVTGYVDAITFALEFRFTWHKPVVMQSWSAAEIHAAAYNSEPFSEYTAAEAAFIRSLGEVPKENAA